METAVRLNRDDFTVFVDFYGHTNEIVVRIHNKGWVSGRDESERYEIDLRSNKAIEQLMTAQAYIIEEATQ
jgi:hypothetical protein